MQECKELIQSSVTAYQHLLIHAQEFAEVVARGGVTAKQVADYTEKLQLLQSAAETADAALFSAINRKTDTIIAQGLLQEQQGLMEELRQVNDYLLPRIANLMDMTRAEMTTLRKGVKGIAGYHSHGIGNTRNIIKTRT